VHESCYFLLALVGRILADAGQGETPDVPAEFLSLRAHANAAAPPPLDDVFSGVVRVAQADQHLIAVCGLHSSKVSPRLGAAITEALTRLARTYLFPVAEHEARVQMCCRNRFGNRRGWCACRE